METPAFTRASIQSIYSLLQVAVFLGFERLPPANRLAMGCQTSCIEGGFAHGGCGNEK
jgi:hypothetical protein